MPWTTDVGIGLRIDNLTGVESYALVDVGADTVEIQARDWGLDDDEKSLEEECRESLTRLRRSLAYFGLTGELCIEDSVQAFNEEHVAAGKRVLDSLPEEFWTITPEDVLQAHNETGETNRKTVEGFSRLALAMQEEGLKRGLDKEERENMTVGEFLEDTDTEDS